LLPTIESVSRAGANGAGPTTTARLFFLAGPRLLQHLDSTHTYLTQAAGLLSCAPPSVPDRINQVLEDRRQANKRVDALEAELAGKLAEMYIASLKSGSKCRHEHRTDDSAGALVFLGMIAGAVTASAGPDLDFLLVLSSSPSAQSHSSTSVVVVVGSDEARVKAVGEGLKGRLGVKGGGKGPRWSGKFTGVWKESKEHAVIDELLEA
jgi:misacylated tRNA(Ala) deacylase